MEDNQKPVEKKRAWGRTLSDLWLDDGSGISDPNDPPRYANDCRLHPAEWKLLECAARGEWCVLSNKRPEAKTENNIIRPEILRFMALGGDHRNPLHDHGVQLKGAFVDGELNFDGSILPENFTLGACKVAGDLVLRDCSAETFAMQDCSIQALLGDRFECTGSMLLRDEFHATDEIRLLGAKIGGELSCRKASFDGTERSLSCDGIETKGSVFLCDNFYAAGTVRLLNAKIGGNLDCGNASFNGTEESLSCDGIETKGDLFLCDNFYAAGTVRLLGAKIGGDLTCSNGNFEGKSSSLAANRSIIGSHIFLINGFRAAGKVSLENVAIGTGLSCTGGQFNASDQALSLKFSTIDGNVDFGVWKDKEVQDGRLPCSFDGSVSLQRAQINGDLIFTETRFNSLCSVNLRNADIKGQLFWRNVQQADIELESQQEGDLTEAEQPTSFVSELNLASASCQTLNMDWDSWTLPSQIRLDHFTYGGFSELPSDWNVKRWVDWLERQPEHHLNERFRPHPFQQLAKVLDASGFEEEALRIRMERRERQRLFTRDHEPRSKGLWAWSFRHLNNFWRWIQKIFIGHGYRPGMAVIWLLALSAIGTIVFQTAAYNGIMTLTHPLIFKEAVWEGDLENTPVASIPKDKIPIQCRENWVYPAESISAKCAARMPSEYSSFNAVIYSLDVSIPVVNFRMEDDWSPRVVDWKTGLSSGVWWNPFSWSGGWWVRVWEWVQIAFGWALSLLFVSAIGGVIRRD